MRKTILGKRRRQQIAKEQARQLEFPPVPEISSLSPVEDDRNFESQGESGSDNDEDRDVGSENEDVSFLSADNEVQPPERQQIPSLQQRSVLEELKLWGVNLNVNNQQFSALLKILKRHHCFEKFPSDCRSLLLARDKPKIQPLPPGEFVYFGIQRKINLISPPPSPTKLLLQINIGGLPLFRSSSVQFWPILGSFVGITRTPFVIAIFGGKKKPELSDHLLKEFVDEFNLIKNSVYNISLHSIVCDAPARSFVKGIKGHTGYHGCDRCDVEGDYVEHRMTFGSVIKNLRTDETFRTKQDEDHHLRDTVLQNIPSLDLVLGFPQDYMHLICLGVVKKLIHLWTSGKPSPEKLRAADVSIISERLCSLNKKVLCEFSRKPRSLDDLERFKATEFRQFLLYTGPIVLKGVVSQQSYELFMTLSVAIGILVSEEVHVLLNDYAKNLLSFFVKRFEVLFGQRNISYNIHCVLHLADDVKRLGPLDSFSAFSYESKLGSLKKLIRSPHRPLQQVINQLCEEEMIKSEEYACPEFLTLGLHTSGPLIDGTSDPQFSQIVINGQFTLKCSVLYDSYFLTKEKVLVSVKNICYSEIHNEQVLLTKSQSSKRNFFSYPCDSGSLNIFLFDYILDSSSFVIVRVSEIYSKVQVFDTGEGLAVFPLHH